MSYRTIRFHSSLWGGIFLSSVIGVTLPLVLGITTSVQARMPRQEIELSRRQDESYDVLLRRAEGVARSAVQRVFDQDIVVTEVAITIVGKNGGTSVPILRLQVTRQLWQREPDPQRWATYFPMSRMLLGL